MGWLKSEPWILMSLATRLQEIGHCVQITTSANLPWDVDGHPMTEQQFHEAAHRAVFPRRAALQSQERT